VLCSHGDDLLAALHARHPPLCISTLHQSDMHCGAPGAGMRSWMLVGSGAQMSRRAAQRRACAASSTTATSKASSRRSYASAPVSVAHTTRARPSTWGRPPPGQPAPLHQCCVSCLCADRADGLGTHFQDSAHEPVIFMLWTLCTKHQSTRAAAKLCLQHIYQLKHAPGRLASPMAFCCRLRSSLESARSSPRSARRSA